MAASLDTSWVEVVKVIEVPLEKAWPIASDFLRFPSLDIDKVECVKGENRVPGCARKLMYKNHKGGQNFVVEELVGIDEEKHKLTYKLVETDEIVELGQESYIELTSEAECRTRVKWPFRFTSNQVDKEMLTHIFQGLYNTWIGELEKRASE